MWTPYFDLIFDQIFMPSQFDAYAQISINVSMLDRNRFNLYRLGSKWASYVGSCGLL